MGNSRWSRYLAPLLGAVLFTVASDADSGAVAEFSRRAEQYSKLRATAKGKVPSLPKSAKPEEIVKHEQSLAAAIQGLRKDAKHGDLFFVEVRPVFLAILKDNFGGADNKGNRAVARQGNPAREKEPGEATPVIAVNAVYPSSSPLSSVPPMLLLQLPKLPQNLEFRFIGQTLILWDSESKLIVDYMKGAAPGV